MTMTTDEHVGGGPAAAASSCQGEEEKQSLIIIRHGDRWDYSHPEWAETAERRGDPPLSDLGVQQARETGQFLDALLVQEGVVSPHDITLMSSPFLRTIQTSNEMLMQMTQTKANEVVQILPEYSIFELDGHGGKNHADLPSSFSTSSNKKKKNISSGMAERKLYFPRLNDTYQSLFVPKIPEAREDFMGRCERSMKEINEYYKYKPRSALILVTHAAGCIALVKAATGLPLQAIQPAGPCGIFRLSRTGTTTTTTTTTNNNSTNNTSKWSLDHYADPAGLNGYTGHLSEIGTSTKAWNHFAPKHINNGYTGPPPIIE